MLSSFREFVSESIEYISSGEKDMRRSKEEMEERIQTTQAHATLIRRATMGRSSLASKARSHEQMLHWKISALSEQVRGEVKTSRTRVMDWDELFNKINLFVEEGIKGEDGLEGSIDDIEMAPLLSQLPRPQNLQPLPLLPPPLLLQQTIHNNSPAIHQQHRKETLRKDSEAYSNHRRL